MTKDRTGWPIVIGAYVTVVPDSAPPYRGKVRGLDEAKQVVTLINDRGHTRSARPGTCRVERPYELRRRQKPWVARANLADTVVGPRYRRRGR